MVGVYKISNHLGQVYIGCSSNVEVRFHQHKNSKNKNLNNSINIYGIENHTFEVIEKCELNVLLEREKYYIEKYKETHKMFNAVPSENSGRKKMNPEDKKVRLDVFIQKKVVDFIGKKQCEIIAVEAIEKEFKKLSK